jgi:hypothetical protein
VVAGTDHWSGFRPDRIKALADHAARGRRNRQESNMFHLVIDYGAAVDITEHPSREVALAELLKLLDTIDCNYRVTQATWEHSSYELLDRAAIADHGRAAPLAGHAVIEEVCGCRHCLNDHDEGGCTVQAIVEGRLVTCDCPAYQPITDEPTLFDVQRLEPQTDTPSMRAAS